MSAVGLGLLGGACEILALHQELSAAEGRWHEEIRVEALAGEGCEALTVALPPGVVLQPGKGVLRSYDEGRRRLGPERWSFGVTTTIDPAAPTSSPPGQRYAIFDLPEVRPGDHIRVDFGRDHGTDQPFRWSPSEDRPAVATFTVKGAKGAVAGPQKASWARGEAPPTVEITRSEPSVLGASGIRQWLANPDDHTLEIIVPKGDPRTRLYPGGGAKALETRTWRVAPNESPRLLAIDLPTSAMDVAVSPAALIGWGEALVGIPAGEQPTTITVTFTHPRAPVEGELADGKPNIKLQDGEIVVDPSDQFWWVGQVRGVRVIPTTEQIGRSLDDRFQFARVIDPGIPLTIRNSEVDEAWWDEALSLLRRRYVIRPWAGEARFPRPLVKARAKGTLTPIEASLLLMAWVENAGGTADWRLVRPLSRGAGAPPSLSGFDEVVVIGWVGERWFLVDPACGSCKRGEIRPELIGAQAWGVLGVEEISLPGPPEPAPVD